MQTRGAHVMGVDPYTSAHVFEDLPDGGRVVLDRDDPADTAAIVTIRAHMRDIQAAFRAGDFTKPFAVPRADRARHRRDARTTRGDQLRADRPAAGWGSPHSNE